MTVLPDLEQTESTPEFIDEVEEALASSNARRRVRGLRRLQRAGASDLVDWCALMLGDENHIVRRTALELIGGSEEGDPHLLMPYGQCSHKGLRAAAVAGLTRLGGEDAPEWCMRGLRDPDDAVRFATARELPRFDPRQHRRLFELALYDPNPQVAEIARKLSARQGYHVLKPRWS
jgi:HEAT repeat protein